MRTRSSGGASAHYVAPKRALDAESAEEPHRVADPTGADFAVMHDFLYSTEEISESARWHRFRGWKSWC
jgi:hypothetical protein